jgi:hypothetical protein
VERRRPGPSPHSRYDRPPDDDCEFDQDARAVNAGGAVALPGVLPTIGDQTQDGNCVNTIGDEDEDEELTPAPATDGGVLPALTGLLG